MATVRPSFTKRQREAAKRERQQLKAAKRAARKNNPKDDNADGSDTSIADSSDSAVVRDE